MKIQKYEQFLVEQEMKHLIFLIENMNEDVSKNNPEMENNVWKFVANTLKLSWDIALPILKAFFEVIHINKYLAIAFYTCLLTYGGIKTEQLMRYFAKNAEHREMILKSGMGTDDHRVRDFGDGKYRYIKGEEPEYETPEEEQQVEDSILASDLEKSISLLKNKGYQVLKPNTGVMKFKPGKTIFIGGTFPYKINYNLRIDFNLDTERQKDIRDKYLNSLEIVGKDKALGLKILAVSMTYMEGYRKGTTSYKTNNPGNIGNVDSGARKGFSSLNQGVEHQLDYLESVALGIDSKFRGDVYKNLYPIGKVISRNPFYSPELKKTVPGFIFVYDGTLEEFLKIYATGARDNNDYLNVVLSFFNTYLPGKVTPKTKISEIINMGGKGNIETLIKSTKNTP
jgi:hypothetical protein